MAGWVAALASGFTVLTLFESMSQIRSVEVRDSVDEFLSTPPGNGLGLDAGQVVEILRGLMLFSGAAAAAALVLAVYVLQRHRAARIGYTIAAMAVMITAPVSGGFLPVLVGFAAFLLWTKPARDWFDGTSGPVEASSRTRQRGIAMSAQNPPEQPDAQTPDAQTPDAQAPGPEQPSRPRMPPAGAPGEQDRPLPPPTQGFGRPTPSAPPGDYPPAGQYGQPQGQQPPYGQPPQGQQPPGQYGQGQQPPGSYGQGHPPAYGQHPQGYQGYQGYPPPYAPVPDPDRRPGTVTAAAWVTWVFSGLTALAMVLTALALVAAQDQIIDQTLDQLRQNPSYQNLDVAPADLIAALWVMLSVTLLWCVVAMVLAFFAFRRSNGARITLIVSASVTALFSVLLFASGISLVTLLAGIAVVVLLLSGGANRWYSRTPSGGYGQPPYTGQGYPGGQPGQGQSGHGGQDQPYDGPPEPPSKVW